MQLISFAVICVIWGATWIAMKFGIAAVPPLIFAGTRFIAAGLLLFGFLRLRGEPIAIRRSDAARLALVTLAMVVATTSILTGDGDPSLWIKLLLGYDIIFTTVSLLLFDVVFHAE